VFNGQRKKNLTIRKDMTIENKAASPAPRASVCSTAEFRECYISKFMGGEFRLKEIRTVGDLRRGLQSWIDELGGWGGDDAELYECEIMRDRLIVVLKDGVVQ
jgi:hypothetical protein